MALENCPECGALYVRLSKRMCPSCLKKEDEDFVVVKKYLDENPSAYPTQISEETGVKLETIIRFIKDKRLIAVGNNLVIDCKKCGKPALITEGEYCEECKLKLTKLLDKAAAELSAAAVTSEQVNNLKRTMVTPEIRNRKR